MEFKIRLLDLREQANLKQYELAEVLNLKPSAISKYEKGLTQPSIQTLVKLSEIFSVSIDYILGVSSVKNPYSQDDFTPKEVEIVAKFRKLSNENQIRIDERMATMIENQKSI